MNSDSIWYCCVTSVELSVFYEKLEETLVFSSYHGMTHVCMLCVLPGPLYNFHITTVLPVVFGGADREFCSVSYPKCVRFNLTGNFI